VLLLQDAAPCRSTVAPSNTTVAASGGAVSINIDMLTFVVGGSGSGNWSAGFSVAANTGAARSGTITVAGQTFTVSQDATP